MLLVMITYVATSLGLHIIPHYQKETTTAVLKSEHTDASGFKHAKYSSFSGRHCLGCQWDDRDISCDVAPTCVRWETLSTCVNTIQVVETYHGLSIISFADKPGTNMASGRIITVSSSGTFGWQRLFIGTYLLSLSTYMCAHSNKTPMKFGMHPFYGAIEATTQAGNEVLATIIIIV